MKLNANTASFILIAFFATSALSALTVDDAVSMAIKNNVSIKTGQITLDAAKRADSHSWNSISPSASVA